MPIDQLLSDFLTGLTRVSEFFKGVDTFFSGVKWFMGLPADLSSGAKAAAEQ